MLIGWIEENGRKYYLDRPGAAIQGQMAEGGICWTENGTILIQFQTEPEVLCLRIP
uniref:hypothetical protein n=1 Tax=Clostridium sp. NkU-1 TaxID=1095009 RepID=UPI000AACF814